MASKAPPPPSSPPAGVPSGNGKFIVLAVVLLGGIGAIIAWKRSQKAPDPIVLAPDAGAFAPPKASQRIDDDIPLPPAVEDASVADAGKKQVAVVAGNPCEVTKCSGTASPELEATLASFARRAHRCYDTALGQDPTLRGKVSISVRVASNGQGCSATVVTNELGSSNVASCVAGYFRGQNFPAPRGGCVDANVPINFVPRQ
jgi:hypothetical protein